MPTSITELLSRMTDVEHSEPEKVLKLMLYGPPGGGKTVLAVGIAQQLIAEGQKIIYVDSADGWVSLKNHQGLTQDVIRLPYRESSDLFALATAIDQGKLDTAGVVVIDELSSIQNDILDSVARQRAGTRPEDPLPEIEGKDYRPMGDTVRSMLNRLSQSGLHVILIAHDNARVDHRKVTVMEPSLPPKLLQLVQGLMHVTGRVTAEIGGTQKAPTYTRTVQAAPSALVQAKTRIGSLRTDTKVDFGTFSQKIADWVNSGQMAQDLVEGEHQELMPDELPTDGIPAADPDDTTPAYVGED